jgi:hypothetical protein
METTFSICDHCGQTSVWGGALVFAFAVVACVALGCGVQRVAEHAGQPFKRTAVVITLGTLVTAIGLFWWSHSASLAAPCLAVLLGLFHRRSPPPSLFHGRG